MKTDEQSTKIPTDWHKKQLNIPIYDGEQMNEWMTHKDIFERNIYSINLDKKNHRVQFMRRIDFISIGFGFCCYVFKCRRFDGILASY